MSRALIWVVSGLLTVALTAIVLWPAYGLTIALERLTEGRLTLGDAEGTVWSGSGVIAGGPRPGEPVMPLLPGRFSWHVSPMALLGRVAVRLENPTALASPLELTGNWAQWQVSPGALVLPADQLSGLGAPLNTVRPAGEVRASWGPLDLARADGKLGVDGTIVLDIQDLSSPLAPIKPLGAYRLTIRCAGLRRAVALETIRGPLLLKGSGGNAEGPWRFSGRAEAAPGHEKEMANFLNLLGESRREGDKQVIALQF